MRLGGELFVEGFAASLLRSGWGTGMGVDSQSVGGDNEDWRLLDLPPHLLNLLSGHRARQSRRARRAFDEAPIIRRSPAACGLSGNHTSKFACNHRFVLRERIERNL